MCYLRACIVFIAYDIIVFIVCVEFVFFLLMGSPPIPTPLYSAAASDVYKGQVVVVVIVVDVLLLRC